MATRPAGPRIAGATRQSSSSVSPPGSIDATGTANESAALQAWLNTVPDGSNIVFDGTYRVDQQLTLAAQNNLTFIGGDFICDAPTYDYTPEDTTAPYNDNRIKSWWKLTGCSNIVFDGVNYRGANAAGGTGDTAYHIALEAQMGWWLSGCTNIEIRNTNVGYIFGDYVYMAADTSGVEIHHNEHHHNGRQGYAIVDSSNIHIHHNDVYENRRAFIDIEPNALADLCENIVIEYNTVGPTRLFPFTAGGSGTARNVSFNYNDMVGDSLGGSISSSGTREDFEFIGNTATHPTGGSGTVQFPYAAFVFSNVDGLVVRDNVAPVDSWRPCSLVGFTNCTGIDVRGNTVAGAAATITDNGGNTFDFHCGNRLTVSGAFDQPQSCP